MEGEHNNNVGFMGRNVRQDIISDQNVQQTHTSDDLSFTPTYIDSTNSDNSLPPPTIGFQTGRGKKIQVTKASMKKASTLLANDEETPQTGGFQTGRGKPVQISEKNLQAARDKFEEDFDANNKDVVSFADTCKSLVDSDMLDTPNNNNNNTDMMEFGNEVKKGFGFVGFQTGRGKAVQASEKSLHSARNMFKDLEEEQTTKTNNAVISFGGFQTGRGKTVKVSEKSLQSARNMFKDDDLDNKSTDGGVVSFGGGGFGGFQTGRGKSVQASAKSLQSARNMFKDIDSEDNLETSSDVISFGNGGQGEEFKGFGGFKTGKGKSVQASAKSLQSARNMFKDLESDDLDAQNNNNNNNNNNNSDVISFGNGGQGGEFKGFGGFQTGRGKSVQASAKSLKSARNMFKDIESEDNLEAESDVISFGNGGQGEAEVGEFKGFGGFQTGRGKSVKVSGQALKKVGHLFNDDEDDYNLNKKQKTTADDLSLAQSIDDEEMENLLALADSCSQDPAPDFASRSNSSPESPVSFVPQFQSPKLHPMDPPAQKITKRPQNTSHSHLQANVSHSSLPPPNPARTQSVPQASLRPKPSLPSPKQLPSSSSSSSSSSSALTPVSRPSDNTQTTPSSSKTSTPSSQNSKFTYPESLSKSKGKGLKRRRASTTANVGNKPFVPPKRNSPSPSSEMQENKTPTNTVPPSNNNAHTYPPRSSRTEQDTCTPMTEPPRANNFATPIMNFKPLNSNSKSTSKPRRLKFNAPPMTPRPQTDSTSTNNNNNNNNNALQIVKKQSPVKQLVAIGPRKASLKEFFGHPPHPKSFLEYLQLGVRGYVLDVTSLNAKQFRFPPTLPPELLEGFPPYIIINELGIGVDEMGVALIDAGADQEQVTPAWLENHYRWVVWKLACMERSFPEKLGGRYLTPGRVLQQLKYRYERDVNRANRSAIKKILERDEAASRYTILCVAAIKHYGSDDFPDPSRKDVKTELEKEKEETESKDETHEKDKETEKEDSEETSNIQGCYAQVELTDGWYGVTGVLDKVLTLALRKGKIQPGQKLRIYGAKIAGTERAVTPLEACESTSLLLQANSTHRAPWHAKLGFQKMLSYPVRLRNILADGGLIPQVDVIIQRVYPKLFMETVQDEDGNEIKVTRGEKDEEYEVKANENRRELLVERKTMEMEKRMESRNTRPKNARRLRVSPHELSQLMDGVKLHALYESAPDPYEFQQNLAYDQRGILARYIEKLQEDEQSNFNAEVMRELEDISRKVTPIMRFKVVDAVPSLNDEEEAPRPWYSHRPGFYLFDDEVKPSKNKREYMLSVWNPDPALDSVTEGKRFQVYSVLPSKRQFVDGVLQLTTMNESTGWKEIPMSKPPATPSTSLALVLATPTPTKQHDGDTENENNNNNSNSLVPLTPQAPVLVPSAFTPRTPYTPRSVKKLDQVLETPNGGEFDVVGAVVHTTEKEIDTTRNGQQTATQTVFLLDSSQRFLAVRIRGQGNLNVVSSAIANYEKAARSKIGKAAEKVKGAPVLGFTDLSATEYSDICSVPKQPYLKAAKEQLIGWVESSHDIIAEARNQIILRLTSPLNTTPTVPQIGYKPPMLDDDAEFDSMLLSHMDEFENQQKSDIAPAQSQTPHSPSRQPTVQRSSSDLTPSTPPNNKYSPTYPVSPIPFSFDNCSQSPSRPQPNVDSFNSPSQSQPSSSPYLSFTPSKFSSQLSTLSSQSPQSSQLSQNPSQELIQQSSQPSSQLSGQFSSQLNSQFNPPSPPSTQRSNQQFSSQSNHSQSHNFHSSPVFGSNNHCYVIGIIANFANLYYTDSPLCGVKAEQHNFLNECEYCKRHPPSDSITPDEGLPFYLEMSTTNPRMRLQMTRDNMVALLDLALLRSSRLSSFAQSLFFTGRCDTENCVDIPTSELTIYILGQLRVSLLRDYFNNLSQPPLSHLLANLLFHSFILPPLSLSELEMKLIQIDSSSTLQERDTERVAIASEHTASARGCQFLESNYWGQNNVKIPFVESEWKLLLSLVSSALSSASFKFSGVVNNGILVVDTITPNISN